MLDVLIPKSPHGFTIYRSAGFLLGGGGGGGGEEVGRMPPPKKEIKKLHCKICLVQCSLWSSPVQFSRVRMH